MNIYKSPVLFTFFKSNQNFEFQIFIEIIFT